MLKLVSSIKTPLALTLLLVGSLSAPIRAQTFPTRQVTIVSPYQAGGTSDIIARSLAQKLGDLWNQTIMVENRPGANGGICSNTVGHAPSKGYKLLVVA